MAEDDTAALVVALSAQVSKFEKDMKGAVDIADRRTREIESTFTRLNSTITGKLSSITTGWVGNLGFAGSILTSLGPAGFVAAAGAGAAAGAIFYLANATAEFSEKSKALKEASETAGLSIGQMKALGGAGKQAGLDFDESSAFFTKFIANLAGLREGSGPLYDALLKIDTGLLRELAATKDSATAIDLLVKGYARLTDQTSKLNLARAAGGRAGLSGSRLLEGLANNGGMQGINDKAAGVDEEQIRRAAEMRQEIDAIEKKTKGIWGQMFSDEILARQKQHADLFLKIAEIIDRIVNGSKEAGKNLTEMGDGVADKDNGNRFAKGSIFGRIYDFVNPSEKNQTKFDDRFGDWRNIQADDAKSAARAAGYGGEDVPLPRSRPSAADAKPAVPAAVDLQLLQRQTALLGEAITQGEQWKLKRLEIAAAAEKGGISDGVAQRALAAFNVAQRAAAVAVRERLAVATQQQITDSRLEQLQQDRIKYGLSENDVQRATVVVLREAKQASDALAVRQAYLPGLKQLEQDSRSLAKGLDSVLSSGLNTFTDDLTAFVTGTKTAKDAFAEMTKSILSDIVKLTIRQVLVAPLAGGLGGLFGTGGLKIPGFATGTDSAPGGPAIVGENGPELVNLPKGSQVIPNHVAARGGSGSPNVTIVQNIDATGADAAAISRLHQGLVEVNASIEKRVGNMLAQQRRYN